MPQPNGRQKIPLGRQKPVSSSRRKRRIRKIMPYRFASTGLITGYLHFSRDIRKNGWLVRDGCIAVDMESQHWSSVGTKTFRTVGCFAGVLRRRKALPVWQR